MTPARSPWMNSEELREYLRKPTLDAARIWARRRRIVPVRAGGTLLYARADVEKALTPAVNRITEVA